MANKQRREMRGFRMSTGNALFVGRLARATSVRKIRRLVSTATNSNLETLGVLARNFLERKIDGRAGATAGQLRGALTPYARQIRKIARRHMSLEARRRSVLNARGGFLPLLIKAAAFALPAVLGAAIK